jgi:hypothetical protein
MTATTKIPAATAIDTFKGMVGYTSRGEWGPESEGWETASIEDIRTYSGIYAEDDGQVSRDEISVADAARVQTALRLMQLHEGTFDELCRALDETNWS